MLRSSEMRHSKMRIVKFRVSRDAEAEASMTMVKVTRTGNKSARGETKSLDTAEHVSLKDFLPSFLPSPRGAARAPSVPRSASQSTFSPAFYLFSSSRK